MDNNLKTLFQVIGSPLNYDSPSNASSVAASLVDSLFDYAFENRVALLFLESYVSAGGVLSELGQENYLKMNERKDATDAVIVKLSNLLERKFNGEWVLFKSLKPFPSTPNDTDWFPFDIHRHKEMCDYLLANGFCFLEKAPLQTTLIDDSGTDLAASDKRGGVWYIDCYKTPGADYFIYLDSARMSPYLVYRTVLGVNVPTLASHIELCVICFHSVFPERTYSVETFYLILYHLNAIQSENKLGEFVTAAKTHFFSKAVSTCLHLTQMLHIKYFGVRVNDIDTVITELDGSTRENSISDASITMPYNFSITCFWACFFEKLKDPISRKSLVTQMLHMLNPLFCWGVIKVLYKRLSGSGLYKQM